jgi:hypothetical protein
MLRWFLSYHTPDYALAKRLKAAIERRDPSSHVFLAPEHLQAGHPWSLDLEREIAAADGFIQLIGQAGIGDWQVPEYDVANNKSVKSRGEFPVILILLEGQPPPRDLAFNFRLHRIISSDPASEQVVTRVLDAGRRKVEEVTPNQRLILPRTEPFDKNGRGTKGQILEELIEAGRLPLTGSRIKFTQDKFMLLIETLHEISDPRSIRIESEPLESTDLIAVCTALVRLGRTNPRLHARWGPYEDLFMKKMTGRSGLEVISSFKDRATRIAVTRQLLELRHLHDVSKFVHGEMLTSPLAHQDALDLDIPQLALGCISLEMRRLNARAESEKVIALYNRVGKGLIDRYKHLDVSAIAVKLFREPNADMDIKTCIAHVYRDVSDAYTLIATKQNEMERRETLRCALAFVDDAFEWYSSVKPSWLHGLANLNATKYVFEMLYGRFDRAKLIREQMVLQFLKCTDFTRLKALKHVREDDRDSLIKFLVAL